MNDFHSSFETWYCVACAVAVVVPSIDSDRRSINVRMSATSLTEAVVDIAVNDFDADAFHHRRPSYFSAPRASYLRRNFDFHSNCHCYLPINYRYWAPLQFHLSSNSIDLRDVFVVFWIFDQSPTNNLLTLSLISCQCVATTMAVVPVLLCSLPFHTLTIAILKRLPF